MELNYYNKFHYFYVDPNGDLIEFTSDWGWDHLDWAARDAAIDYYEKNPLPKEKEWTIILDLFNDKKEYEGRFHICCKMRPYFIAKYIN